MKNLALASLLFGVALSGCETVNCTEIGCNDAIEVTFDADDGAAVGAYLLKVDLDGAKKECRFTLGARLAAGGAGGVGGSESEGTVLDATCTGSANVGIEIRGTRRFEGFVLTSSSWNDELPSRVTYEVTLDGDTLLEDEFKPSFEEIQPNGDECPPICNVAQHEATLSAEE